MSRVLSAITIFLILLSGCQNESSLPTLPPGHAQIAAQSSNQLAFDLYGQLAQKEGNIFFSPSSISTALTMTYTGTAGSTATETAETLHLKGSRGQILADNSELQSVLTRPNKDYTLNIANRIWGQESFPFHKKFNEEIQRSFKGGHESCNFKTDANNERIKINNWVAGKTENKIKDLLPSGTVNSNTRMVLTNAVYFLGQWKFPFAEEQTSDRNFYQLEGPSVAIPTMNLEKQLPYYSDENMAMVALPYSGNELDFLILLPHDKAGLSSLENHLTLAELQRNIEAMSPQKVDIWLPRLDLEQSLNLTENLKQLGMKSAFEPGQADFSNLTDQPGLFITSVVHKSYLKVDEQGTEAAAASGVTISVTSMPAPAIPFIADHAFMFLIRHQQTGCILFMGRMAAAP